MAIKMIKDINSVNITPLRDRNPMWQNGCASEHLAVVDEGVDDKIEETILER